VDVTDSSGDITYECAVKVFEAVKSNTAQKNQDEIEDDALISHQVATTD